MDKQPALASASINTLPDLPFGLLFEKLSLVDLLSAQFVSQRWRVASIREACTPRRQPLTLCIDGWSADQKTLPYLTRNVWILPHAEKLKASDGVSPLLLDYGPSRQRLTPWNILHLGTREENPVPLDGTLERAQEHERWQREYNASFALSLDRNVFRLLALFPLAPTTLTIVCRSEHSDFLRLLPLLRNANWKDRLLTCRLYSSHPEGYKALSHYRSGLINHPTNRPLLSALNGLTSLRNLTLDLLGEEGDTLNDRRYKFNQADYREGGIDLPMSHLPSGSLLGRLESFTFADRNCGSILQSRLLEAIVGQYFSLFGKVSLGFFAVGNSIRYLPKLTDKLRNAIGSPERFVLRHLNVHLLRKEYLVAPPVDSLSPYTSLTSLALHLDMLQYRESFLFTLRFLAPLHHLLHLRLHLVGEQVTVWYGESLSLEATQLFPALPSLTVLSLILMDSPPISHPLPSLLVRLFPSLQVIVLTQRTFAFNQVAPIELEPYFTAIGRHFAEAIFSTPASRFSLLEARLYLYADLSRQTCQQSEERTWTVAQLQALKEAEEGTRDKQ